MWLGSRLQQWPNHFCFPGQFQQDKVAAAQTNMEIRILNITEGPTSAMYNVYVVTMYTALLQLVINDNVIDMSKLRQLERRI